MANFYVSCLESRIDSATNVYTQFKIGPFEKNQTLTVANNLRRTLLSELDSIAIIAVKVQGVKHEYSSIKGVRESVLDILLNVKQIVLTSDYKLYSPELAYLSISGKTSVVKAGDIQFPSFIQCINPDHEIATLCADGALNMVFLIYPGKNYWMQLGSQQFISHCWKIFNKAKNPTSLGDFNWSNQANILPLDAVFMPIERVNYTIETDEEIDTEKPYDHIFLEIWTNGSIAPLTAIEQAATALVDLFKPFQNLHSLQIETKFLTTKELVKKKLPEKTFFLTNPVNATFADDLDPPPALHNLDIGTLNLSLRPYTCLKQANIQTIGDLLKLSSQDLLLLQNFGKRSLEEVENSLYKMGLFLQPKSKKLI